MRLSKNCDDSYSTTLIELLHIVVFWKYSGEGRIVTLL